MPFFAFNEYNALNRRITKDLVMILIHICIATLNFRMVPVIDCFFP